MPLLGESGRGEGLADGCSSPETAEADAAHRRDSGQQAVRCARFYRL